MTFLSNMTGNAITALSLAQRPRLNGIVLARACERLLLSLLSAVTLLCISLLFYRSSLRLPINYNEGWNAFHTAAILHGMPLYPHNLAIFNNYPPLSFYLVSPLAWLMGDGIMAGRLVAAAAFLVVMRFIYLIVVRLGADRTAGLFAAILFGIVFVSQYTIYVGMDDPQMLAHATMLTGLWCYVRRPEATRSAILAGVLMVAAGFIKHNLIALPVAFVAWLAWHDRRALLRFIAASAATAGIGLSACLLCYGSDFVASLLAPRAYIHARAIQHLIGWFTPLAIVFSLLLLTNALSSVDRWTRVFLMYFGLSIVVGAAGMGGAGVNFNIMFDVVIAAALSIGYGLSRLDTVQAGRRPWVRFWLIASFALTTGLGAALTLTMSDLRVAPWLAQQRAEEQATEAAVAAIAERQGPAFCEQISLCYWAGKDFVLDPFNFQQAVLFGLRDPKLIADRVQRQEFAVIALSPDTKNSFTIPEVREAVADNYQRTSASGSEWEILVPKR